MKTWFSAAVVSILTAVFLSLFAQGRANVQDDRAQDNQQARKSLIVPKGTNVVLRLAGDLRKGQTSLIVVVQDVVVEGVEVIARDAPAQFVIARKSPGKLNMPGSLMIEVTGVVSLSGDVIPVSAAQTAKGESPCVAEDCLLLPLLFWMNGDPGKIEAGLLFNAKVTDDVILNRELYGHPSAMPVSTSIQRLHVYQIVDKKPGTAGMEAANNSDVHLDGKRIGSLEGNQYACVNVSPGTHILRVGREVLSFDIDASSERYTRVLLRSVERRDRMVSVTNGYELGTQTLKPGHFKQQSGVSCFESMSRGTNTQTE
jgi:hypothetical protein